VGLSGGLRGLTHGKIGYNKNSLVECFREKIERKKKEKRERGGGGGREGWGGRGGKRGGENCERTLGVWGCTVVVWQNRKRGHMKPRGGEGVTKGQGGKSGRPHRFLKFPCLKKQ